MQNLNIYCASFTARYIEALSKYVIDRNPVINYDLKYYFIVMCNVI
jgi:hypothetical protein